MDPALVDEMNRGDMLDRWLLLNIPLLEIEGRT